MTIPCTKDTTIEGRTASDKNAPARLALIALTLVTLCLLRLLVGVHFGWPDPEVLGWRVLRLLAGLSVGASLGVAGTCLQALVKNPLASPDLLGVSAGAGLGAVLAAWLAPAAIIGSGRMGLAPPAVIGGMAALGLIYGLSRQGRGLDPIGVVLVGVVIAITCGSGTRLAEHMMPPEAKLSVQAIVAGELSEDVPGAVSIACGLAGVLGGVVVAAWSRRLDALSMSDDEATSVGVSVTTTRLVLFLMAGLLTAASVVVAGPIGLVGLIAPHGARMLLGPRHAPLVAGAAMCGAALVVAADAAVASVPPAWGIGRPPIGVLLTLIGGPIFIVMLRRELARQGRVFS